MDLIHFFLKKSFKFQAIEFVACICDQFDIRNAIKIH